MKKIWTFFLLSMGFTSVLAHKTTTPSTHTQQYYPVRNRVETTSLNGTWLFQMQGDSGWRNIQVPGNWETQGVATPQYGRRLTSKTGIYKRKFEFKKEWQDRDVILRLDAIQNGFTAYVNGNKIGSGHSAHTMHQFNITPYLKDGSNDMEIHVCSHSDYWMFDVCDAWSLTGIKSNVEIFSVSREGSLSDAIFTSKVNTDNSATISIQVKANGGSFVTASLLDERYNHVCDMKAKIADGSATMTAGIAHPMLWNAETPNLYRLDVKLFNAKGRLLQSIQEKVGIREIRVENCKVLLNNKEIFLRGACLSENDAIEGSAMSQLNRCRQLQQMKDANINFIRMAHYPLDPVVARLCDEMGFYVCCEIPFASRGDEYLKNDPNVVSELKARAKAAIDRDRNNPCIIMWSLGNENKIYPCQDSVLLFTKNYDPTRLRGVPQAKGAFMSYIKRPSKFVDVICGHYANDGVLADAVKTSKLPIINTEYAHSLGTSFGELEHKYDIFRNEPKIAGGSVWSYQDQSIMTYNYNQENQVQKGVRIDSLRYIDCYGLNPVPENSAEKGKEGTDGVVFGDGYPQEDYFELAQVYTPVFISPSCSLTGTEACIKVENRFDFISLRGYCIKWQLRQWHNVIQTGTVYLSADARQTETARIDIGHTPDGTDRTLCMQVIRPDGSLCYERSITIQKPAGYEQMVADAGGAAPSILKGILKEGFKLRVGRPLSVSLDYRRKGLWLPYILNASDVRVRKKGNKYMMTCRWESGKKARNFVCGEIEITVSKDKTTCIDYTLVPSDSIEGKFLDYGLTMEMPDRFTDVAWIGQGPFSQTPDKTAYNNRGVWRLHKDDIRFYGNRADVGIMTARSESENITVCTEGSNILLENANGRIMLTDNLIQGTYGTKFMSPKGMDAGKIGKRTGRIVMKANAAEVIETVFGSLHAVNPEQPYLEWYGK